MGHTRAHVRLITANHAVQFVNVLAEDEDTYYIEDFDQMIRVNAKSVLGVMYAATDFSDRMYLVNATNDGRFPFGIDSFRA